MSCAKIKICDVRTIDALKICQDNNVDFIGLHQITPPITEENVELFQSIVTAAKGIKTVLLSKKVPINDIVDLLRRVPFDYVQLHRTCSILDVVELKNKVLKEIGREIGVIAVFEAANCDFNRVREISRYTDFILFDSHYRGGTGLRISKEDLKKIAQNCEGIDYFVAGGLNPTNVKEVINIASPYGVDVQTGLESSKHIKDPEKVKEFVCNVRFCEQT